jgi:MOSC domain-containing protein YiiM
MGAAGRVIYEQGFCFGKDGLMQHASFHCMLNGIFYMHVKGSWAMQVMQIRCGKIQPMLGGKATTAIRKMPVAGAVSVAAMGLDGDQQADKRYHGGTEKAVHAYCVDHYAQWQHDFKSAGIAADNTALAPGGFGENLVLSGADERTVCMDDIVQVGTAILQVSQGRQPCWKLNVRFGVADMAARVQNSGRTGWYYRVLQAGEFSAGDQMVISARPLPEWSIARVNRLLYAAPLDERELRAFSKLPHLPISWQKLVAYRLEHRQVEDWQRRIEVPQL